LTTGWEGPEEMSDPHLISGPLKLIGFGENPQEILQAADSKAEELIHTTSNNQQTEESSSSVYVQATATTAPILTQTRELTAGRIRKLYNRIDLYNPNTLHLDNLALYI
jgi:hypothetical protein